LLNGSSIPIFILIISLMFVFIFFSFLFSSLFLNIFIYSSSFSDCILLLLIFLLVLVLIFCSIHFCLLYYHSFSIPPSFSLSFLHYSYSIYISAFIYFIVQLL
jgi:hypothetical protein